MGNYPIADKFARIGAEVRVEALNSQSRSWNVIRDVTIDVQSSPRGGERFLIRGRPHGLESLEVVDLQPRLRHLLLMQRQDGSKTKILCGHDERHWFACTLGKEPVKSVVEAMEFLKPEAAILSQRRRGVRRKNWFRRHNPGFLRQGEWFFIPAEGRGDLDDLVIRRNEPITRNISGKAHFVEEFIRTGGEQVRLHPMWAPQGISELQYERFRILDRDAADDNRWSSMVRNPEMFGRGAVRHPDHATIHLEGWHQIVLNRESTGDGPVVWFD